MTIEGLRDAKIVILGLGVNNLYLTAYLVRHGCASVTVRDKKAGVREEFEQKFPDLDAGSLRWETTPDILAGLEGFDVAFRSPSISVLSPELVAVRDTVHITSQTKLFFDLCPAKIIGVTGSKGKGTTCTLINSILAKGYSGGSVYMAGNIGVDPFQFLDSLNPQDLVILELSSFQLHDLEKSPHISVLLRITPDHLDHHKTMEEYVHAKLNIIKHQHSEDVAIVCVEQPESHDYVGLSKGTTLTYARHTPQEKGGWAEGETVRTTIPDKEQMSIDVSERLIPGDHNLENIVPACLVGSLFGISPEIIRKAVVTCEGLPHRLHTVGEYQGVQLVDDSIATTPESCRVAMQAFEGRPIHLIAGGRDKGQEYAELAQEIVRRCKTVSLLPGEATGRLEQELSKMVWAGTCIKPRTEPFFPEILEVLRPHLNPGDVILLSPAAASDAPYYTYVKRAEAFIKAAETAYGIGGEPI